MPNFSGVWDLKDQVQAIAAGRWTGIPALGLYVWGENNQGQLGDGTIINKSSPVQIGALTSWSQVSASLGHTAAVKTDGTLWAWGNNGSGQIGDNTVIKRSSPVQIGALTNWSRVSAGGGSFTVAVKTDGTMWSWGGNFYGQLGINTSGVANYHSSPVQIGALTGWAHVSAGHYHTASIKTDGTMWTWGNNGQGRLGDGTVVNRSSPVQIGVLTNWEQASAGRRHVSSVKTDGTLWAWGYNGATYGGVLGLNGGSDKSSPVQVGALTNWAQISSGERHMVTVKTDGTLWTWGIGNQGQLGDGTAANKSSPVLANAQTNWLLPAAGRNVSAATKTDGTLWTWGRGLEGPLGHNNTVALSSPVQVGTLANWAQISAGGYSMFATESPTN